MFFEGRAKEEDNEYYSPIGTHIKKLKQEKENLEEYHKQLSFIELMLNYIVVNYSDSKRENFNINLENPKYNWINSCIVQAINILFKDSLSNKNSFSKTEIKEYIKKIKNEMFLVNGYLDNIIKELDKYNCGR